MHTPLPWARDDQLPPNGRVVIARTTGYVPISAERAWDAMPTEEDEANAALIVRAVNSHGAMLEALKALLAEHAILNEYARITGQGHPEDGAHPDCPAELARLAIEAAEPTTTQQEDVCTS